MLSPSRFVWKVDESSNFGGLSEVFLMNMRRHILWPLCLLLLLGSHVAWAADITNVADSFDTENKNPFDFRVRLSYQLLTTDATIARERGTRPEQFFDYVPEFKASYTRHMMNIMPKIGLYKDLEIRLNIPIVFSETFNYKAVTGDGTGTSLLDEGIVSNPLMRSRHGPGLGDMMVGLRWAPFNDYRDRTVATWVIGFNWLFPTGQLWDPKDPKLAADQAGLGVGRGAHILSWYLALSKRAFIFEPYIKIQYDLYTYQETTKEELQNGLNSISGEARAVEEALTTNHAGHISIGSEIVFWEHYGRQQKLALDLRFTAYGRFRGRYHNIFTDMLASYQPEASDGTPLRASLITDNEQQFAFAGQAAFHFKLAKYGYIRIEGMIKHVLPFFLTTAKRGVDKNGNGFVDPGTDEVYPYHVRTLDGIGKRIRQIDTFTYKFQVYLALTI